MRFRSWDRRIRFIFSRCADLFWRMQAPRTHRASYAAAGVWAASCAVSARRQRNSGFSASPTAATAFLHTWAAFRCSLQGADCAARCGTLFGSNFHTLLTSPPVLLKIKCKEPKCTSSFFFEFAALPLLSAWPTGRVVKSKRDLPVLTIFVLHTPTLVY